MNPKLDFLMHMAVSGPLNILILAADHRAASHAAQIAARIDTDPPREIRLARHLFADVEHAAQWSIIKKEAVSADALIAAFGDEFSLPERLRILLDFANRMRREHFRAVLALSNGWVSGATRRWLSSLTRADAFEHVRTASTSGSATKDENTLAA